MILHILRPEAEDYTKLTEICQTTKRRWGYPDYLIDLWKDELTITPRYIRNNTLLKVENEHGKILGFGSIDKDPANGIYEIKHLWFLTDCGSKHVGSLLLDNLEKKVADPNTIKVIPDQNMLTFYQKNGYQKVGEVKSKLDGRKLPLLKKVLKRSSD